MDWNAYTLTIETPLAGRALEKVRGLLGRAGLQLDERVSCTAVLWDDDGQPVATGSLDGDVIKCVATDPALQGEGLCERILSALYQKAFAQRHTHLFLYTKPENASLFSGLGFYTIAQTADVLLMENRRDGLKRYLAALERPPQPSQGAVGAIVANCNPLTKGHLYLAEQAAKACEWVHFFVLSEDKSAFPADVRLTLAREGLSQLPNVLVHATGGYMISNATFPTYFLKKTTTPSQVAGDLDLRIFCRYFAPALGISVRFVGEEPVCPVTTAYNESMKTLLPQAGIAVREIPRLQAADGLVSASTVRVLLAKGELAQAQALVPPCTARFLGSAQGREVISCLRRQENVAGGSE